MNAEGRLALFRDLAQLRGLAGLAAYFGPEEIGPAGPFASGLRPFDLGDLTMAAFEALPDEGDRLVAALAAGASEAFGRKLPFCGRRTELETLYNAVRDAVAGRKLRIIEVTGSEGLGKTRLLAEALAIIDPESRGIQVLPIAARPQTGPAALIAQLTRRRFGIGLHDTDQVAYDRILDAIEAIFDERSRAVNTKLLGYLAGLRAMGPGADALSSDIDAFRRQAQRALVAVFRHDLAEAPRILVVQTPGALHGPALEVLLGLVRELHDTPLVLAVLGEPDVAADGAGEGAKPGIAGADEVVRVRVEALAQRDMERLVTSLFVAPTTSVEVISSLVEAARGSPRLALENARLLIQRGQLDVTSEGLVARPSRDQATFEMAYDLDQSSRFRVAALGRSEAALLQVAAVAGRSFSVDGVVAVAGAFDPGLTATFGESALRGFEGVPRESVERALEPLAVAGLVQRDGLTRDHAGPNEAPEGASEAGSVSGAEGGTVWRFAHGSDRARLLATLTSEALAMLHALCAQWLEARRGVHTLAAPYEAIGAHWLAASRPTEAANALVRAAESARSGLDPHRARYLYRAALSALGLHTHTRALERAPQLISVLLDYADFAHKTGGLEECRRLAAAALEAGHALEPRAPNERTTSARTWLALGRAYRGSGAYANAKLCLDYAADFARRASNATLMAETLGELARVFWLEGAEPGHGTALRMLAEVLDVRRQLGVPGPIGETLGLIANIRIENSDFERAREPLEEARALAHETRDLGAEARSLMALGAIAYFRADHERAVDLWKEGLLASEIAGERELIGAFLNNIGEVRLVRGELDYAAAALLEAREVTMETGDLRTLTDVLKNLSGLYRLKGDLVRAQGVADEALALATAMGSRSSLAAALRARGVVRSMRAADAGDTGLMARAGQDLSDARAHFLALADLGEIAATEAAIVEHRGRSSGSAPGA